MATKKTQSCELTLPELVEAMPVALASGYGGVRSGRTRDLPDTRTVRWYQTLGMVDRPAAFRGRTALYGRRHLLQLAAIKKLQSSGLPLADIQRGLAGKIDAELARAVGISLEDVDQLLERAVLARSKADAARLVAAVGDAGEAPSRRATAFWKARPPSAAMVAAPAAAPAGMQSSSVGDAGVLLWTSRDLTAAELTALDRLTKPLAAFLSSVQSSAGGTSAECPPHAVSPKHRPEEGVRP